MTTYDLASQGDLTALTARVATLETKLGIGTTPSPAPVPTPAPSAVPTPPTAATPPATDANGHSLSYATPKPSLPNVLAAAGFAVEIAFSTGEIFVFNEADGKAHGIYSGPFVSQSSTAVTRADFPGTVHFRHDTGGGHDEIIVEVGRLFGAANAAAANLGPYTATVLKDGAEVASINVPYHWWFSRWRWQSAARKQVRQLADLAGHILPYDPAPSPALVAKSTKALMYAGPMDNAGVYLQMPTVGDRDDIGLTTETQSEYLVTGNPIALQSTMAQAEASGSVPWHMRDETTGAPVNWYTQPQLQWYQVGTPYNYGGKSIAVVRTQTTWNVDDMHQPALNYIPYLLTDDPYLLEEMQFQLNFGIGFDYYHRGNDGAVNGVPKPVLTPSETRGFAWALRTLFELEHITPATTPSWLLNKAFYTQVLADNLNYFTTSWVTGTNPNLKNPPYQQAMHIVVFTPTFDTWMTAFLVDAMALGVHVFGHTEWQAALDFTVYPIKRFTDEKSGWPIQWCTPYEIDTPDMTGMTDFASLWAQYSKNKAIDQTKFPAMPRWAQGVLVGQSPGYLEIEASALGVLAHFGDAEAAQCFANMQPLMNLEYATDKIGRLFKWSFASA